MTTLAARPVGATRGPVATHLVRSEYLKIRTTNTWWIFGVATIFTTALALLVNMLEAHYYLKDQPPTGADSQAQTQFDLLHNQVTQSANVFTSGQFLGAMFAMLLAILMVTNEYHHQTVTTTFLTTPHRTAVILSKFVAGMIASVFFWIITEVLSIVAGLIFFQAEKLPSHLGDWDVVRAILLNLMVFALWAVFGVGIGVLIRSQIGATLTAALLYVVGTEIIGIAARLIHTFWIKQDWVLTAQVIVPSEASSIAISPSKLYPESPPQWVGAAVLIGYGLLLGAIGTSIMRRRDVS